MDVLTKKHFGKKFFCEASNGAAAPWANVTVEMRRKFKKVQQPCRFISYIF